MRNKASWLVKTVLAASLAAASANAKTYEEGYSQGYEARRQETKRHAVPASSVVFCAIGAGIFLIAYAVHRQDVKNKQAADKSPSEECGGGSYEPVDGPSYEPGYEDYGNEGPRNPGRCF